MRAALGYVCSGRHHRQDGEMVSRVSYHTHSLDNMLAGTCAVSEWASRCPKIIIIHFASLLYPRFIKFILISPEVKISTTYDTIFDSHDLAR